jgi:DNA polymerase-3 subunit gamma/tau
MRAVLELTHRVTVAQLGQKDAAAVSAEEREAIEGWAGSLAAGQLHRLWQLLLKGFEEVRAAPDPLMAAQMALLRVMHATDMPDPGTLARKLEELASRPVVVSALDGAAPVAAPVSAIDWRELVDSVERTGALGIANMMRMQVRIIDLSPGKLVYTQPAGFKEDIAADLRTGLLNATGERWLIERGEGEGAPTLVEQQEVAKAADQAALRRSPLVEATFAAFPNAEFVADEGGERSWSKRA